MDIAKEDLTFDDDEVPTYTVQIRNFHHKMKNWSPTTSIRTKTFKVQDVDLYLKIFPNGKGDDVKGHVSVYLFNKTSKQVYVHYIFYIGIQGKMEDKKGCLNPGASRGWMKFCNHVRAFPIYKPDHDLNITCKIVKITTEKVVWDLFHETNNKFKESKANQVDVKAKLAMMEIKLEELQKLNNNKVKKPPCPICFEEMSYDTKIAQCINGHHLCWSCKEKLEKKECPSCGLPVNGRAFGMEGYLRSIFAKNGTPH